MQQKNKIYLSGKIGGLTKQEYERNFRMAAIKLKLRHGCGNIEIINPVQIRPFLGIKSYWFYMIADLWCLSRSHSIYMLSNWTDSRGAKIEIRLARFLNKKILFQ